MDILTQWTLRKRLEHVFNGVLCCRDISCQPPERYAQRMLNFVEAAISSEAPSDDGVLATPATGGSAAGAPAPKVKSTRPQRPPAEVSV